MWQRQQQVGSHMACALFEKFESDTCETSKRKLQSSIILGTSTKRRIFNLGQKVWKAFKFESSRRVIIVALAHCSCKSTEENFDRHVTDVVAVKFIFDKNSYHRSLKLLVAALASVRAG